jgi:hypothetical protein
MKKRVYIHIGYFKTGTTAVQKYFGKYCTELTRLGILYPISGRSGIPAAHHDLALSIIREAGMILPLWFKIRNDVMKTLPKALWTSLACEIGRAKQEKVLISSEEFVRFGGSEKTREYITRIRDYLSGNDVTIICYLRRQDDYYESFYNTTVKEFEQKTIHECMSVYEKIHFDYLAALDPWEEVFGRENMIVRLYDREELLRGIVPDILDVMDIEGYPEDTDGELQTANLRLNNKYLEIKRWLNHFNKGVPGARVSQNLKVRELFQTIDAIERPLAKTSCRLLSFKERMAMMKRNEAVNREISERYFKGKWPLFKAIGESEMTIPVVGEPEEEEILKVILGMTTAIYLNEEGYTAGGDLLRRVKDLESSRSWKYTAPLRKISSLCRKLMRKA